MSVEFVKGADAYAGSVAFTGNVTAGNHVIVVGMSTNSVTAAAKTAGTATLGSFAAAPQASEGGIGAFIHQFIAAITGTGTLTLGITAGGDDGITVLEVSGLDGADLIETQADTQAPAGDDPHVAITTTVADSLLVGVLLDESGTSGTLTAGNAPGAWALVGNQAGHQHGVEHRVLTATISGEACNLITSTTPGSLSIFQVVAYNGTAGGGATISVAETLAFSEALD